MDDGFIRANTRLLAPPLVPEVALHLSEEPGAFWERVSLERGGDPTLPFWAFAWPGGQGLARHVLDHPELVAGRRVLDVGSGSGLVAIAAARAGAAHVVASEVDAAGRTAIALNAAANRVRIAVSGDMTDGDGGDADTVLVADVFYDRPTADRVVPFLARAVARGATVLVGDPGRPYLPHHEWETLAVHHVRVPPGLEDRDVKRTTVWRARPPA
jgi:predicted nicotinamide N-methyase